MGAKKPSRPRARLVYEPETAEEMVAADAIGRMARRAGMKHRPHLAVIESPQVNAFAIRRGSFLRLMFPSHRGDNFIVGLSRGVMDTFTEDEQEGVIAHEIAHAVHNDSLAFSLLCTGLLLLTGFGMAVVAYPFPQHSIPEMFSWAAACHVVWIGVSRWFLRRAEYRADEYAGLIAGKPQILAALRAVGKAYPSNLRTPRGAFAQFFSSHPDIEKRIARIERSI